jgi:hypothetical protein
VIALGFAPGARADGGDVSSFKSAVARGAALFDQGRFAEAREQFMVAYRIHPAPTLLFNIASTYRREGDHAAAVTHYKRFVASASESDPRRRLARETIGHLETLLREREALARAAKEKEKAAREKAAREKAAREKAAREKAARVRASAGERARARARAGERARVGAAVAGESLVAEVRGRRSPMLMWSGLGLSLAGAAGLGVAWMAARDAADAEHALDMHAASGQPWDNEQEQTYERGSRAQSRALTWAIAGGAAVVGGAALYLWGRRITVSTTGSDVVVGGRF